MTKLRHDPMKPIPMSFGVPVKTTSGFASNVPDNNPQPMQTAGNVADKLYHQTQGRRKK